MITFERGDNGEWTLQATQMLPQPRERVFPFFADARNLQSITPPKLGFSILTPEHELEMREGLLIDYRIRMRGLPMRWRSKISEWNPPHHFVDEQVRGPYALWHHTHHFEEAMDGSGRPTTCMTDVVRYRPPLGAFIGGIANRLFVQRELRSIFEFRNGVLRQRFGESPGSGQAWPASASTQPVPAS